MGIHMDERTRALCYFYRHPPPGSNIKPQKFSKIALLVRKPGQPRLKPDTIRKVVVAFHSHRSARGRKAGWRKTSPAEDKLILKTFLKVRQPLGARVDARDVYNDLSDSLRKNVSPRTVRERLKDKGYVMQEKMAKDDMGEAWHKQRLEICRKHLSKRGAQWVSFVQAIGDFRYFSYHPRTLRRRYQVESCERTIMRAGERKNEPAFFKPRRHVLKRFEFKRITKIKVCWFDHVYRTDIGRPMPFVPSGAGLDQDVASPSWSFPQEFVSALEGTPHAP